MKRAAGLLLLLAAPAFSGPPGRPASVAVTAFDGRPIRTYLAAGSVLREPVALEDVSPWVILAVLAAEDRRFYSHHGVDLHAVARAAAQNLGAGRVVSGASTLTQQLARSIKPAPRTFLGKLGEVLSALKLEANYRKDEILEAYLNAVPFGNNCEGIQAAALSYFGVPASQLSLSQAAGLAGIPRGPALYDPVRRPAAFAARRAAVLRRMLELGYIDGESYRLASAERSVPSKPRLPFSAPQFADFMARRAPVSGGIVRSSLDPAAQEAAAAALSGHLSLLRGPNNATNGAALVLDNATGEVRAWVGSRDFFDKAADGEVDGVLALRQPGSALKPFLYALAISRGYSAGALLDDEPLYASGGYTPANYDKNFHGKVRLRQALACSYNIPAVRVAEALGPEALLGTLRSFGFAGLDRPASFYGAGLALGNGEVTLLELAAAYAALARGGIWTMPVFEAGKKPGQARRAVKAGEAFIINSILSDNQARAAAFGQDSPLNLPFELAAKTGTSKDYRDNWAVGYTPEWTVAVWVGNFNGEPMRKVSGISGAAPVMREIALAQHRLYGSTEFRRPPGVQSADICAESGLAAGARCRSIMREYFLSSTPQPPVCRTHDEHSGNAADTAGPVIIKFPRDGDIFKLDPAFPKAAQALFFKSSLLSGEAVWVLDSREVPGGGPWPLSAGRHTLYFRYDNGAASSPPVKFSVID